MTPEQLQARRAIEGLRAGVPSRAAVRSLETTQNKIRDQFRLAMDAVRHGQATQPLMIAASFGDGKSHLLQYLDHLAGEAGFVTCLLVVSPEMLLGDPQIVLNELAESAIAPGCNGKALRAMTEDLNSDRHVFGDVRQWAEAAGLEPRFLALLLLLEEFQADKDLCQQILDDFEGNAMRVTDIRRKLRELNRAGDYPIRNPRAKLLAHDRLRLFAQLCRVCTGQGLVVFFDETERIRRFSRKQRFEAYREIGWWAEQAASPGSGILPVMAMIDAFVQETITAGLNDEAQLRDRPVADRMEQTRIQAGIDCLKRSERLEPTTMSQRDSIRERVRTLYQLAYQVDPDPAVTDPPNATTLRQYIRTWITRWDLARYYHEPVSIQADQLAWENNGFEEDAPPDAG